MNSSRNDRARLYTISNDYIRRLKEVDPRVQNNYQGNRLYCKIDLKAQTVEEDIHYYLPLASAKESQDRINNASLFKLYGKDKSDYLGAVHVNNMIPVPESYVQEWSPEGNDSIDKKYVMLVVKQSRSIKKHQAEIFESSKFLYNVKTENIDRDYFKSNRKEVMFYKNIMNDVKGLEKVSSQENQQELKQSFRGFEIE